MPDAFLLTRQWQDSPQGLVLDYWWASETGPIWTRYTGQELVFFVAQSRLEDVRRCLASVAGWRSRNLDLRNSIGAPVSALYFARVRHARAAERILAAAGIAVWEADIRPPERFLMERFVTASATIDIPAPHLSARPLLNPTIAPSGYRPSLKAVSVDIETSMTADTLYSIAVWAEDTQQVFMVGEAANVPGVIYCSDMRECLQRFFAWVADYDPDIFLGWNLVQFDLWVLENLCRQLKLSLALGRAGQPVRWREEDGESNRRFVTLPGRVALDGIELLKAANYQFESYALNHVANTLLGSGKLLTGSDRGEDISQLFISDKPALAAYNLKDCELVWNIFSDKKLLAFAIERSQLTGVLLDRIGGSVAAFEYLYLPRLHRQGYVAPNLGELRSDVVSPGGYVMDSCPGIYDNILVLDFKSLYPSIMRSFLIDPCAFWIAEHQYLGDDEVVAGFNDARFSREGHILPDIITRLSSARDQAKREKNAPLSHAIKIIMNSFYGVLGSTGCRFFDPRVCSSITLRGHEIIQRSREWIEQQGYAVIYGDTDSLFVWVDKHQRGRSPKTPEQCSNIGARLARELNAWWRERLRLEFAVESALEIQFETHYLRFLMPTMRGSELGTKKRYAGMIETSEGQQLVFKGLESVRTDWTRLARNVQETLYARIFKGEPYREYLREQARALLAGQSDAQLLYRKRLRRQLGDYRKNVPPHVQAARKLAEWQGKRLGRGDWIDYVITVNGPEPATARRSALDYQHYLDRQLAPVVDSILYFKKDSLAAVIDQQLALFGS